MLLLFYDFLKMKLAVFCSRYADLRQKFKERFGHDPKFYVRSPGRVNLIGQLTMIWMIAIMMKMIYIYIYISLLKMYIYIYLLKMDVILVCFKSCLR